MHANLLYIDVSFQVSIQQTIDIVCPFCIGTKKPELTSVCKQTHTCDCDLKGWSTTVEGLILLAF